MAAVEFNPTDLLEYLGGDPQFAAEMIDLFFNDTTKELAGAKAAFAEGAYDRLYEHAHALKGSGANIRAIVFRDYAQELATAASTRSADCAVLMGQLERQYARVTEVLRSWQSSVRTAK